MTSRKLVEYLSAEPFRPFLIKMASGQSFEIRHPEMILVGKLTAKIYAATGPDERESWHDASMMLMETVEPLGAALPTPNS